MTEARSSNVCIEISDESDSEDTESDCSTDQEAINFAKLSRLVLFICNKAVRRVVKKCLSASKQSLYEMVQKYKVSLHPNLTRTEYQQLFFAPTGKTRMDLNVDSLSFTVVYKLLVYVFNLPPHERGWGQIPRLGDQSTSACLDRIFSERSAIFSHSQDGIIDDQRFEIHWENLSNAILQLEKNEFSNEASIYSEMIENIYKDPLDDHTGRTYIRQLQQLQEEEKELKHYSVVLKGKMGSLKEHYEALHQDEMHMKEVLGTFTGSVQELERNFENKMREQTDVLLSYLTGKEDERVTSESKPSASTSKIRHQDNVPFGTLKEAQSKDIFDRSSCHFDCIMNRDGVGISTAPNWLPQLPAENLKSRLKYYRGVLAKSTIPPFENFYFEVDATVEVLEDFIIDDSTVFEVGLCDKNELDKYSTTTNNKKVYSVRAFVCEKHASICLTLCNNSSLYHSEMVPFSDQLIYSNNWKIYVDLKKMFMAVFSGTTLIHWQSGVEYFQNMGMFLGIGHPRDLKCSINIREFRNPATGDILNRIRDHGLDSPYVSDYIDCETGYFYLPGNRRIVPSVKCLVQRLPFLDVPTCCRNITIGCDELEEAVRNMKPYFEFNDWVSNVEKMAANLMSESNVQICMVVSIRSLVAQALRDECRKESFADIGGILYEPAMMTCDFFLCSLLIFHEIPLVSDEDKPNPLRVLCKCGKRNFTRIIEGFLKYKIEQNKYVAKDLKIDQVVLARNKDNNGFCLIVYLNGYLRCPLSNVNGLRIIWQSRKFVNGEGKLLAEKFNIDYGNSTSNLPQIPGDIAAKLFAEHSNLTMISACPFKSKNFSSKHEVTKEPCIVLYCRSKGLIPIAEKEYPREINSATVDVREGFCCFGGKSELKIGQPIYVKHSPHYGQRVKGTLGGFVELPNGSKAILTCAHLFFGINDLHGKKKDLNPENKFTTTEASGTTTCGKLEKVEFRHGSPRETSVDAALVHLYEDFEQGLTISEYSQKDIDMTGTTHQSLSFETGDSWNEIPSQYLLHAALKYGAETKLTCGNLKLQNGHFHMESHMVDLCETCRCIRFTRGCMHNKFRFFHQFEVYSKTNDVFFAQGDSGALVFMLGNKSDPQLHCIGMAIGLTTNGSCIVTPISDIFKAFDLRKGFVKLSKRQTEISINAPACKEMNTAEDSMSKVLAYLGTMNASMNEMKSDISEMKRDIETLKKKGKEENTTNQRLSKKRRCDDS